MKRQDEDVPTHRDRKDRDRKDRDRKDRDRLSKRERKWHNPGGGKRRRQEEAVKKWRKQLPKKME